MHPLTRLIFSREFPSPAALFIPSSSVASRYIMYNRARTTAHASLSRACLSFLEGVSCDRFYLISHSRPFSLLSSTLPSTVHGLSSSCYMSERNLSINETPHNEPCRDCIDACRYEEEENSSHACKNNCCDSTTCNLFWNPSQAQITPMYPSLVWRLSVIVIFFYGSYFQTQFFCDRFLTL